MATSSRLHALKVAVADGLALRSGLSGVQIASVYLGDETSGLETIQLMGPDDIDQEWREIGKFSRDESLTVQGMILVVTPGAGETVARTARARAFALMAEVEAFFMADPSVGGVVKAALGAPTGLHEGIEERGRWALIQFAIKTQLQRLTVS